MRIRTISGRSVQAGFAKFKHILTAKPDGEILVA
jgi:hypothetical protein